MKIKNKRQPAENIAYNTAVNPLIQDVLPSRDLGLVGYIQSDSSNYEDDCHLIIDREMIAGKHLISKTVSNYSEYELESSEKSDQCILGPCETALKTALVDTKLSVWILTGAVGSGKSTISRFIFKHIEDNLKSAHNGIEEWMKPLHIQMDFVEISSSDKANLLTHFKRKLYAYLAAFLENVYSNRKSMDFLIGELEVQNRDYSLLFPFRRRVVSSVNWNAHTDRDRACMLLNWIEDQTVTIDERIDYLSQMINALRYVYPNNDSWFLLLLDNIDQLPSSSQSEILTAILAFANSARVRILVPMRCTTFGILSTTEQNVGLMCGHIEHAGIPPVKLVVERLKAFRSQSSEESSRYYALVRDIDIVYRKHLQDRIDIVLEQLHNSESRLSRNLRALSGLSCRRGLILSQGLFVNIVVGYDKKIVSPDDLMRCVLIHENTEMKMISEDPEIANLFISKTDDRVSFICIRILQFIYSMNIDCHHRPTIAETIEYLKGFGKWNTVDWVTSINYLLRMSTRLLWMEGRRKYSINEFKDSSHERIYLTQTGKLYLEVLLGDLVYLQEALLDVSWPVNSGMPYEVVFHTWSDRMSFLHKALRYLCKIDFEETKAYHDSDTAKELPRSNDLLTTGVVVRLSKSVISIHMSEREKDRHSSKEDMRDWLDLLIRCEKYTNKLYGTISNTHNEMLNRFAEEAEENVDKIRSEIEI